MTLRGAHIVVAGLGDIGGLLARRLVEAGVRVTGIRRSAQAPVGVTLLRADLRSGAGLAALREPVDAAVCCVTADSPDEAGYRASYLDGAQHLARALAPLGCRRLLFVSSSAVYAQTDGGWVDEGSPTQPEGFRGRIMLEAEAAAAAAGLSGTAVRCAGIYGPGRTQLLRRVLQGTGVPAQPVAYGNRIHRDDVVGVLQHLLEKTLAEMPVASRYVAVDDAPAPLQEVLAWLARRLAVQLDAQAPLARGGNKRLDNARLRGSGYRLIHPDYRSGYGELIDALQTSGELAQWQEALRPAP